MNHKYSVQCVCGCVCALMCVSSFIEHDKTLCDREQDLVIGGPPAPHLHPYGSASGQPQVF